MKKHFVLPVLLFLIIFSASTCSEKQPVEKNKIVKTEKGEKMLFGSCTRKGLSKTPFQKWFNKEYKSYQLDKKVMVDLSGHNFDDVTILIVLGTWCSDSQREVPRFFKLIDALDFPQENISIVALDEEKQGQDFSTEEMNISRVPTFIFYRGEDEIGRIVEIPVKSMEKDFYKIIQK